jgi:predicted Rossmann fold flavoprotein
MALTALLEAEIDADLFLIERNNSLGKKVTISGGGRCNITTGIPSVQELLKRYPRGASFLKPAMHRFPPSAVMEWFEARGVPLKIEADQRVFPISDQGQDVVDAFKEFFHVSPCKILLSYSVINVAKVEQGFQIFFKDRPTLEVTHLILTTGGQAYRHTGSTGDGYAFAEILGHHLTPLAPSLNAFMTKENWPKQLSGVSWKNATLTAHTNSPVQTHGPFLFTHQGITGPAVFALSSLIAFETYDPTHPLPCTIDLFPLDTEEIFLQRMQKIAREHPKKFLPALLEIFVPRSLADALIATHRLDNGRHLSEQSNEQLRLITRYFKAIPLTLIGRTAGEEFVTAGGVETSEVNPRTMESYLCPQLYFAGELLNIDGYTGGFNLQASWATGRLAGESLASSLTNAVE